jgi:Homeodomain-like domain
VRRHKHKSPMGRSGCGTMSAMCTGIEIEVAAADRARLEAIVADRNCREKHVERARIVLLSADRVGTVAIMRQVGCAKATVWRWQERFMEEGVDGLLRDPRRPPGKAPLPQAVVERVVDLTLGEPPGETTHWSGRAMAKAAESPRVQATYQRYLDRLLEPGYEVALLKYEDMILDLSKCSISWKPPASSR